ncbi:MAG: hypothetical protein JRI45_06670 [Deltaproteobacteria bacterium]|nr:hypothetical protein [Deltaproteobacteria bacterium]
MKLIDEFIKRLKPQVKVFAKLKHEHLNIMPVLFVGNKYMRTVKVYAVTKDYIYPLAATAYCGEWKCGLSTREKFGNVNPVAILVYEVNYDSLAGKRKEVLKILEAK